MGFGQLVLLVVQNQNRLYSFVSSFKNFRPSYYSTI
jgi:hypothetical protein